MYLHYSLAVAAGSPLVKSRGVVGKLGGCLLNKHMMDVGYVLATAIEVRGTFDVRSTPTWPRRQMDDSVSPSLPHPPSPELAGQNS